MKRHRQTAQVPEDRQRSSYTNVDDLDDLRVFRVISRFLRGKDRQPWNLTIFPGGCQDRTARIAFRPGGRGVGGVG